MGFLSKLFNKKTDTNVNKNDYDSPLNYCEDGSWEIEEMYPDDEIFYDDDDRYVEFDEEDYER